ncbi:MAG: hypothetical protein MI757_04030, partial [Pirellulales bacterium]|nr:hypothetical protein [Pirellulales bacterium]
MLTPTEVGIIECTRRIVDRVIGQQEDNAVRGGKNVANPSEHLQHLRAVLRQKDAAGVVDWTAALREVIAGWDSILSQKPIDKGLLQALLAEAFLPGPDLPSQCTLLAAQQQWKVAEQALTDDDEKAAHRENCKDLLVRISKLPGKTRLRLTGKEKTDWWFYSLQLRASIIDFWRTWNGAADSAQDFLAKCLRDARQLWQTVGTNDRGWDKLAYRSQRPPACWHALRARHERFAEIFAAQVQDVLGGWHDPVAPFLCNTFLVLDDPTDDVQPPEGRRNDGAGCTWILFAVDAPDHHAPGGMLLRFSIEIIPNGCGVLYPHPSNAAHVVTDAIFQRGLRNAWQVILGNNLAARQQDYRWSLSVLDHSTENHAPADWHQNR